MRLVLAALVALVATALAAAPRPASAGVLRDIEVTGNERTARDVIVRALAVAPGDLVRDEELPRLEQAVYNLRIFRSVRVTSRPVDGGVALGVEVEERWTLIPIPVVGASDGAFRAGLAVFETNLLGLRKELGLAGFFSSRGQTAFALYRDPALLGSRAILLAEGTAENERRELARDSFDPTYAWAERRLDVSVRPGWQVTPRLAVRAGPFAVLRRPRAVAGYAPPTAGRRTLGLAADLEYLGQDYLGWFDAGPIARARVREGLTALGSDRPTVHAHGGAGWAVRALRDHAASVQVTGWLAHGDAVLDAWRLGGRPGTRGFKEQGLWAERAATATLDYQIPVWRPGWGTVAALGFVDGGVARWRGEATRWVAPGAGFRVYVRNVALPAMGLDLARSSAVGGLAASFFVGFGS